jgi:Pentapeptide repeats (8 copies)
VVVSSLVKADFTNANLRGASLEDTSMDEAILTNAVAVGTYFSSSILQVANLQNVDFTDASFPPKVLNQLCQRTDINDNGDGSGTNPVTGVSTRESLMCP